MTDIFLRIVQHLKFITFITFFCKNVTVGEKYVEANRVSLTKLAGTASD